MIRVLQGPELSHVLKKHPFSITGRPYFFGMTWHCRTQFPIVSVFILSHLSQHPILSTHHSYLNHIKCTIIFTVGKTGNLNAAHSL